MRVIWGWVNPLSAPVSEVYRRYGGGVVDERDMLVTALENAGVRGPADFGRFVSNLEYFAPSQFDERAAMPVLLEHLPHLQDPKLVAAAAGHLRRPWARPAAFEVLAEAFRRWAPDDRMSAGWHLGDALGTVAEARRLPEVLALVLDPRYGRARQQLVGALWRFKKEVAVAEALVDLVNDPDVALHAMSSLRRVIGNERALPLLQNVRDTHPNPKTQEVARRQARAAAKAIG